MHLSRPLSGLHRLVAGVVAGVVVAAVVLAAGGTAGAEPPVTVPVDDDSLPVADPLPAAATQTGSGTSLVGTFLLDPGDCAGPSGTYFRMAQPGGSPDEGPWVENNDSPCDDASVTPLQPGTDGGLVTGSYQPHPDPAFDGNHGVADRITEPQAFFGTDFAVATNPVDPQTDAEVPAPDVRVDDSGALSGDLRAFAAAWQTQHFNQGSPKPDGSTDGGTTPVTGTYDADTGRFTLEWSSQIQGGAFNNFTGVWHLEGEFRPDESSQPTTTTTSPDRTGDGASTQTVPTTAPTTAPDVDATTTAAPTGSGSLARTGGAGLPLLALLLTGLGVGAAVLVRRASR